jgi:dTDP-4-amino-4,6-dideoxygalactose transaminase
MIPFLRPTIGSNEIALCNQSIASGWLAYGQYTARAEELLSQYFNSKDFVLTSSCTASLQMALILSGVGHGDEVITTPLSWVGTSNVILYQGAKVVFADVDPLTGLIDIEALIKKTTAKTKAIIVVDLYGLMFDYQGLRDRLPNNKIKIIEDAAHAIGSKYAGQSPGSIADFACFSFHAAKNITSGQGGGLICREYTQYKEARLLRRDGVVGRNQDRKMISLGYKFDSTDFQSALLIPQIERIEEIQSARVEVYQRYESFFKNRAGIRYQMRSNNAIHSGHMFVIWLQHKDIRAQLIRHLEASEIQTSVHYNPIHLEPFYREKFSYSPGDYPVAERIGESALSLPTYSTLTLAEQTYVCETIDQFFESLI